MNNCTDPELQIQANREDRSESEREIGSVLEAAMKVYAADLQAVTGEFLAIHKNCPGPCFSLVTFYITRYTVSSSHLDDIEVRSFRTGKSRKLREA